MGVASFTLTSSFVAPGAVVGLKATLQNLGNQAENVEAHWRLYNPSGALVQDVTQYYALNAGASTTGIEYPDHQQVQPGPGPLW